jgi:aminopeptidase N
LVWGATWDMVRDGALPARRFLDLFEHNAGSETVIGVLQRLMLRAVAAIERFVAPEHRPSTFGRMAAHARMQLERAEPGSDQQLAWARQWATLAREPGEDLDDVHRLYEGSLTVPGLGIDTDLRWYLVICLARAGRIGEEVIAQELAADDTDMGRRHAATARAARPQADAKAQAWRTLLEDHSLSHTMSRQIWGGFSAPDQHEVLSPYLEAYFDVLDRVWAERSLDWAISFSNGMFPDHGASPELLRMVDDRLAEEKLPGPLRRVLLEQRDGLVRMLDARALDATID